ncbi:MAG: glycosyltransferase, partial [Patescibacteria group bacterium]
MRILLITNLYPPHGRGGAEIVVAQEARELRDQGHEVTVLTTRPFGGVSSLAPRVSIEDGVNVYRYYPLNVFWYRNDYKRSLPVRLVWHVLDTLNIHAWFVTRRFLRRMKPDEVRTHNLKVIGITTATAIRAFVKKQRAAKTLRPAMRWIHFLHDVQLVTPSGLLVAGKEQAWQHTGMPTRVYRAFCRWLVGSPPIVRAPSQWVWEQHRVHGFFPTSVFEKIAWYTPGAALLAEWHPTRPLRFLFVGQLAPHKGILFLLDVIKTLPGGACILNVVGDGPLMDAVREQARDMPWVHIHGRLSLQRVKELFKETDCLLFPSLAHENCPTIIVEALRQGIPVLASRVGGVPEIVQEGMNGWLV